MLPFLDLVYWILFLVHRVDLHWILFLNVDNHAAISFMAVCYVFSPGHIQTIDGVRDLSHSSTSSVSLNHWWKDCLNWHVLIWIVRRFELQILIVDVSGYLIVNIWSLRYIVEVLHFTNLCVSLTLMSLVWSVISSQRVSNQWIILTLFRHNNLFVSLICTKLLVSGTYIIGVSHLSFHKPHLKFSRLLLHVRTSCQVLIICTTLTTV